MTQEQKSQDALAFLKAHRSGVLATLSPEGSPRARLLYYAADDAFKIYFLTLSNTRKVEDIKNHGRAAFVVAGEEVPQTVQIEGIIEDLTDSAVIDPVVSRLMENLKSNNLYFAPLTHFDPGKIVFYCLTPTSVRWGDFTEGKHTNEVLIDITPS